VTAHVIGLTGGIASGKSAVAKLLRERGAAVVDADLLARKVVEPGQPALGELVARFGAAILTHDGQLDRKRLGAIAFADEAARRDLGAITHPRIAAASAQAIAEHADAGANVVFYEAALLVENRTHTSMAALIVVSAPPELQEQRVMARDGLTLEEARARIAAQLPLAEKTKVATWVIENHGDRDALAREVDRVVAEIEAKYGSIKPPGPRPVSSGRPGTSVASGVALVTGFPAFTAKRMIQQLVTSEPDTRLYVLARDKFAAEADALIGNLGARDRAEVLVGDVCDMDLGLSSAEYRALSRELTWIHHLAGIYFMGVDEDTMRRVNVAGTPTMLDPPPRAGRPQGVGPWATAMVPRACVSGSTSGPCAPASARSAASRSRSKDSPRDCR